MVNEWAGTFGDEYTQRNTPDVSTRARIFQTILSGLEIYSILEVGCNKGTNLYALKALYPEASISGAEPNKKIIEDGIPGFVVLERSALDLNLSGLSDLVFTCGVLIHVPPQELEQSMNNIITASNRYVLAIEYEHEEELMIPYRGQENLLWKRPYGQLYTAMGLKLISTGQVPAIDNCTFWLFEK